MRLRVQGFGVEFGASMRVGARRCALKSVDMQV